MAWLVLAVSIMLEVAGAMMMKLANSSTQIWPSVGVLVFYGLALAGLTYVVRHIELSVAYAIWSGVGLSVIACIGVLYFKEPVTAGRVICLAMIIVGVVGLQLASGSKTA